MLRHLKAHPEVYATLEERTSQLCAEPAAGVTVNRVGSMFTFFPDGRSGDERQYCEEIRYRTLQTPLSFPAGPRNLYGPVTV